MLPDTGFLGLGKVIDVLVVALGAAVGWLARLVDRRFKRLEQLAEAALPREEFEREQEAMDEDRQELRKDIKELYAKNESLRETVNVKVEAATLRLEAKMDRLMRDLTGSMTVIRHHFERDKSKDGED